LIILPFFIATIATIIYTDKQMKRGSHDEDKNHDEDKIHDEDKSKGTNLFSAVLISVVLYGTSTLFDR